MTQPLSPEALAWLRQSDLVDGSTYSRALLHLLERVEALEARPIPASPARPAPGPQSAPAIFPVEYADADGDGIRIAMEPAEETGRACWVVRNSGHINACHEFSTPEAAHAAHQAAKPAQPTPAAQPAAQDLPDYTISRARSEYEKANLLELQRKTQEGLLLRREDVEWLRSVLAQPEVSQ